MAGGKAQEVKFALDDSFTQPVCDHSVGFLRFTRIDGIEFAEPAGTGIFAKLGKTYGILTAGHVLNPIATNEAIGLVRFPGVRPSFQNYRLNLNHTDRLMCWNGKEGDPPDVAFLKLPEINGRNLEAIGELCFITWDLRFLRKAYDARSAFAHTGASFPAHVEVGISDRANARAAMHALALTSSTSFVPTFAWFEYLTHLVIVEYLVREIAPTLAQARTQREQKKTALLETVRDLPDVARQSLERLVRWTARFVDYSVVGPMAPNREWALDEVSISALSSAGIIQGDLDMDGRSSIKDRDVGEAIGEYFFGFAENRFSRKHHSVACRFRGLGPML